MLWRAISSCALAVYASASSAKLVDSALASSARTRSSWRGSAARPPAAAVARTVLAPGGSDHIDGLPAPSPHRRQLTLRDRGQHRIHRPPPTGPARAVGQHGTAPPHGFIVLGVQGEDRFAGHRLHEVRRRYPTVGPTEQSRRRRPVRRTVPGPRLVADPLLPAPLLLLTRLLLGPPPFTILRAHRHHRSVRGHPICDPTQHRAAIILRPVSRGRSRREPTKEQAIRPWTKSGLGASGSATTHHPGTLLTWPDSDTR